MNHTSKMEMRFKKKQKVRLKIAPLEDDIEYYADPPVPITKGMTGMVNLMLSNGQYHVEIIDEETGETLAYVAIDEEGLEEVPGSQD